MSQPLPPMPNSSAVVIAQQWTLTGDWYRWLYPLWQRVITNVGIVGTPVSKTGQSTAIATTTLFTVTQAAVYRVSYYVQITTADGVSSSVTVTIRWRKNAVTFTKTFAAVNGDTTSTYDSQELPLIACDSGTVIDYAIAYASNTPAKMKYLFALTVEFVS